MKIDLYVWYYIIIMFPKRSQELNKTIRSNSYNSTPYIVCVCLILNSFGTYFGELFLVVNRYKYKIHWV